MKKKSGANMSDIKSNNRIHILKLLRGQSLSRKDLSDKLGLTPAAVTILVNEMIREGILRETGAQESEGQVGRKKVLIEIVNNYRYVIGVNIDPDSVHIGLANLNYEILKSKTFKIVSKKKAELFSKIKEEIITLLWDLEINKNNVLGVGLGIVGEVYKGVSKKAYGLWEEEVNIKTELEELLDLPVFIENNVRALAEAEIIFNKNNVYKHMIFIKYGPGIGSAIVINNELYRGENYLAGEIGHICIAQDEEICSCGQKGCLETKAAIKNLLKKTGLKEEAVLEGINKDSDIYNAVDKAMSYLAIGIMNMIKIYDPKAIVLYGNFINDKQVVSILNNHINKYNINRTVIIKSSINQDLSIGGIAIGLKNFFYEQGGQIT